MALEFTAHNIRLDDGSCTRSSAQPTMEAYPWLVSTQRVLDTVFTGDRSRVRIADLGCLEGGYSVELARMGFQVLGLEVRSSNIQACLHVKAHTDLPNLEFVQDDVWNVSKYGTFDAIFCCGLLYHLDRPRAFLELLAGVTRKLVILQTHFAPTSSSVIDYLPRSLRRAVSRLTRAPTTGTGKFRLSHTTLNEELGGRWFTEFKDQTAFAQREQKKWSSWDNSRSFWVQREYLLQALQSVGFDLVLEQFDSLGPDIAGSMLRGYYKTDSRGTFIGIRTSARLDP
jgi:SAM-dependent methyltransferase